MQKVEKTYRELLEFQAKVQQITSAPYNEDNENVAPRVLLARVSKKINKALEEYEEAIETIRIKHCLKDSSSNKIIRNEKGQYEFDADGTLAMIKEVKDLQKTSVEISVDTTLPYKSLLATLPAQAQPYWQWEDVSDVLSPVYTQD
jgi:hypothetical protein